MSLNPTVALSRFAELFVLGGMPVVLLRSMHNPLISQLSPLLWFVPQRGQRTRWGSGLTICLVCIKGTTVVLSFSLFFCKTTCKLNKEIHCQCNFIYLLVSRICYCLLAFNHESLSGSSSTCHII